MRWHARTLPPDRRPATGRSALAAGASSTSGRRLSCRAHAGSSFRTPLSTNARTGEATGCSGHTCVAGPTHTSGIASARAAHPGTAARAGSVVGSHKPAPTDRLLVRVAAYGESRNRRHAATAVAPSPRAAHNSASTAADRSDRVPRSIPLTSRVARSLRWCGASTAPPSHRWGSPPTAVCRLRQLRAFRCRTRARRTPPDNVAIAADR